MLFMFKFQSEFVWVSFGDSWIDRFLHSSVVLIYVRATASTISIQLLDTYNVVYL